MARDELTFGRNWEDLRRKMDGTSGCKNRIVFVDMEMRLLDPEIS